MAEIILAPTAQSKVIPLSLRLSDTDTSLVSQLVTNRQFNTADTDAWFGFTLEGLAATTGTFDLTLINLQDKSVFNHTDKMFNTNPFYYKLDSGTDERTNEIRHAGKWVGQLVVTLSNGDSATRKFIFGIEGHILDGTVVQTILLEDYNALIASIDSAIEGEMIAQTVATKLTEKEATFAPRLLAAEQQLANTLNKSAITLTHMFADNTARDAYFVAHPAELIELQFIKVGTTYQQYIEGVWTDSVPIVAEQVSATNQPIVDTGEYFVAETTNEALQELGTHKASTANPHGVTKTQVGLGNVDNTSDANKPVSTATQTALNLKADKATANGLVASVVYNSNVELTPTALDIATGTFTIPAHGLANNDKIAPNFNSNNGFPVILSVYPGGMTQERYYVIVVDENNIKLSKTSGGAPITITSAGVQSKWHFEKWNVGAITISGLPPKNKYRVVTKGNVLWAGNLRILPISPYWYTGDWNGNNYPLLSPSATGYWYIDVIFEVLTVNKIIGTAFNIKANNSVANTLTNINIKYIRTTHNATQITAITSEFSEFIGNGMIMEVYDI